MPAVPMSASAAILLAGFNFGRRIILPRDKKRGDLKPNVRLMLEILKRLKYGSESARAEGLVEVLRKSLEVDIGGVHVPEEFDPRRRRYITGAYGNGLDA